MSKKFTDKVTVITGASSGIGKALAYEFSTRGAKVVLGARQEDKLAEVCTDINAKGGQAVWCKCDVTNEEDCKKLIECAVENFGGVRIEDLVVVTSDGCENFTSSPKNLIEL